MRKTWRRSLPRPCSQPSQSQRHRPRISATPRSLPGRWPGAEIGNLTADASYVGTAAQQLPRYSFPNAYPGASPALPPHTQFDSAGNVIGGFGVENVIFADSHSSYHALQTSLSGVVAARRPGMQASYTWGKSHRRHQRSDRRHGINRRCHFRFLAESVRHSPRKRPVPPFDVTHAFGLSAGAGPPFRPASNF